MVLDPDSVRISGDRLTFDEGDKRRVHIELTPGIAALIAERCTLWLRQRRDHADRCTLWLRQRRDHVVLLLAHVKEEASR
jgi:hypothetical protein